MAADKALAAAVKTEQISVLAIYTEGNEDAWRKNLPDMPAGWMVGMDREEVKNEALYDLKRCHHSICWMGKASATEGCAIQGDPSGIVIKRMKIVLL